MILSFKIDYQSYGGDLLYVGGSSPEMGGWDPKKALPMKDNFSGGWEVEFNGPFPKEFEYKYLLKDSKGYFVWEWGRPRTLNIDEKEFEEIRARDFWRSSKDPEIPLYSSAFTKVLMKRENSSGFRVPGSRPAPFSKRTLRIQVVVPRVSPRHKVAILGNQKIFGDWMEEDALVLDSTDYPLWRVDVDAEKLKFPIQFKYTIFDPETKKVLIWEQGSNRMIRDFVCKSAKSIKVHTDEKFRFQPAQHWRGTGVAVPLFSLRSEKSGGIGEYPDLIKLVDWAKQTGLNLIQLLPLNDTVATHTWVDTYPYKSVSTIALNPDYININKIGILEDENLLIGFMKALTGFDHLETVHYEEVHKVKSKFFKFIFDQQKEVILEDPTFQKFVSDNREWLVPYAAFCYLRDRYETADFSKWPEYSVYDQNSIEQLSAKENIEFPLIAIHYFIQYQAHKQLLEAAEYARDNRVVLKGDIPIGISPHSVEAWTHPELFNFDQQVGAPPDDFSDLGQNWGSPSYNWERMAEDGYSWWLKRIKHMSLFFDAIRLDHIQGYFRIWEIPADQIQGIMGHFNPSLPLSRDEIIERGIIFNEERYTKPYIREYFLHELFGEETDEVKATFLKEYEPEKYDLKKGFENQKNIWDYFERNKIGTELSGKETRIRDGLCSLISEIIFIRDPKRRTLFHPRFDVQVTNSYLTLKDDSRYNLNDLYLEYFYERHENLWRQHAQRFLPELIRSTEMMVCGEDLGMVPDCVREVMRELSILSLEVQRMPKNPNDEFANPANAPYQSVCSTSTHDTSTLRGWWEEERALSQRFFKSVINEDADYPLSMEPWLAKEIIIQHLNSPAMWAVFPIQDLFAINGGIRHKKIQEERINVPAIAQNYWRYRMHLKLEELIQNKKFSFEVKSMIEESGRGQ